MRRDQGVVVLPESPKTPPCHKDRLFEEMKKYARSPRATQLVPTYREFRLGHGDPLMAAAMKHWTDMARPHNSVIKDMEGSEPKLSPNRKQPDSIPRLSSSDNDADDEKEIQLIQHGSPLGGMGMHDIVHISKDEVLVFPCLHFD